MRNYPYKKAQYAHHVAVAKKEILNCLNRLPNDPPTLAVLQALADVQLVVTAMMAEDELNEEINERAGD